MTAPQVYFGNLRQAGFIKSPDTGLDASPTGNIDSLGYSSGGAFVNPSAGTHRKYNFSWSIGVDSEFQWLMNFRNGLYGTGLCYFVDPYIADYNAMPPHWAAPFLSGRGWPSIIGGGNTPNVVKYPLVRTNQSTNPVPVGTTGYTAATTMTNPLMSDGITPSVSITTATAITPYIWSAPSQVAVAAGETYVLSAVVEIIGDPGGVSYNIRGHGITGNVYFSSGSTTITGNTGPQRVTIICTPNASVAANEFGLSIVRSGTQSGVTLRMGNVLIEKATSYQGYFAGSTTSPDPLHEVYAFTGTANASSSTQTKTYDWTGTDNGNPQWNAVYSIATPPNTVPDRALVLLIPPTHQLSIGFSAVATGSAVIRVQPYNRDGSPASTVDLTLITPSSTTLMNQTFSGATYSAIKVYITQTSSGTSTLSLTCGDAIYSLIGTSPTLTGLHKEGRGHTGLRFSSDPTLTYTLFDPDNPTRRFQSAAASFEEIGGWL